MMAVCLTDDFLRRADETGDLPNRHTVLKQPSDAGMLENVRCYFRTEAGKFACAIPALALLRDKAPRVFYRADRRGWGSRLSGIGAGNRRLLLSS